MATAATNTRLPDNHADFVAELPKETFWSTGAMFGKENDVPVKSIEIFCSKRGTRWGGGRHSSLA